jgi:hypothetical protein
LTLGSKQECAIVCLFTTFLLVLNFVCFLNSGGSALSPSGKLLAVTNLVDGVDWYSVEEKRFLSTTPYKLGRSNYVVDLAFLDENTAITGGQGQLIIVRHKTVAEPHVLKIENAGCESLSSPVQILK